MKTDNRKMEYLTPAIEVIEIVIEDAILATSDGSLYDLENYRDGLVVGDFD